MWCLLRFYPPSPVFPFLPLISVKLSWEGWHWHASISTTLDDADADGGYDVIRTRLSIYRRRLLRAYYESLAFAPVPLLPLPMSCVMCCKVVDALFGELLRSMTNHRITKLYGCISPQPTCNRVPTLACIWIPCDCPSTPSSSSHMSTCVLCCKVVDALYLVNCCVRWPSNHRSIIALMNSAA